ncbi:MAG: hypothetical protein ACERKJ_11445, partial [Candidatus Dadabacteria bacterium]
MSQDLIAILTALEKPLKFASSKNFANLDKIKALDQLAGDLTLKALSLPLSGAQSKAVENIRDLFKTYESLDFGQKQKVIESSLKIIERLRNIDSHLSSQN